MDEFVDISFRPIAILIAIVISYSVWKNYIFLQRHKRIPYIKLWLYRLFLIIPIMPFALFAAYLSESKYLETKHLLLFLLGALITISSILVFLDCYVYGLTFLSIDNTQADIAEINVTMAQLYTELEDTKQDLEAKKVKLMKAYEDLKETHAQLLYTEKMASLGQLVAGISHEINTPMGAITAASENIDNLLKKRMAGIIGVLGSLNKENLDQVLNLLTQSLSIENISTSSEDRKKRKILEGILEENQIVDGDYIADLLVDMHLPVEIDSFIPLLKAPDSKEIIEAAHDLADLYQNNKIIELAFKKTKKTTFSLTQFSHKNEEEERKEIDLKASIDNVLILYHSQLKQQIQLKTNFDQIEKATVIGREGELGQVWINLIQNAMQAMRFDGELQINLLFDDDWIHVDITDSGTGISEENAKKIFNPFFTTKAAGEGSGLGLHIIRKIIEEGHDGKLTFQSRVGKTTFRVSLPKKTGLYRSPFETKK